MIAKKVAILLLACTVYGSPILETPEVAAARAAHNAAHATARALNALPPSADPIYLEQPVQDTPEVWAARAEHYKVQYINNEFQIKFCFTLILIHIEYDLIADRLTQQQLPPTESSLPCLPSSLITSRPFPTLRKFGRPNRLISVLTLPLVDNYFISSTTFD